MHPIRCRRNRNRLQGFPNNHMHKSGLDRCKCHKRRIAPRKDQRHRKPRLRRGLHCKFLHIPRQHPRRCLGSRRIRPRGRHNRIRKFLQVRCIFHRSRILPRNRPRRHRCRQHRCLQCSCRHIRPRHLPGCHCNRSRLRECRCIHTHRCHQVRHTRHKRRLPNSFRCRTPHPRRSCMHFRRCTRRRCCRGFHRQLPARKQYRHW